MVEFSYPSGRIRAAFTLIELLIVLAIIGVMMQLLLPAVQSARERARNTVCLNQLRQMGIATSLHVETHQFFPTGGWSGNYLADPDRGFGKGQPGGWAFSLLPYVEQSDLIDNASGQDINAVPLSDGFRDLYQSAPAFLYCPSRRPARPYPFKRKGNASWSLKNAHGVLLLSEVTKSDYAANSGTAIRSSAVSFANESRMWVPPSYKELEEGEANWTNTEDEDSEFYQSGVVYYRSEVQPSQITDGLSHTYIFGEKSMNPTSYNEVNHLEDESMMGDNQSAWVGYEWDNHRVAWNAKSGRLPEIYRPRRDSEDNQKSCIFAFGSAHPTTFNMVFCDGSAKSISYDLDDSVHQNSANREDGVALK